MAFKSDRQRKAVMARMQYLGQVRSSPSFFSKLGKIKAKIEKAREKRLLAKTKKEEKKAEALEDKLAKRIELETKRASARASLLEKRKRLAEVEEREKKTKQELKKFTLIGKVERGAKIVGKGIGERVKIGAEKFAEERKKRREFLKTPEGQKQVKKARERREKFFKTLGKIRL